MAGHDSIWQTCSRCTDQRQALVVAALRHPAAQRINFTYGSLYVTSLWLNRRLHIMTNGMHDIADRVEDGRIPVGEGNIGSRGWYDPQTDSMAFYNRPSLETGFHEAIHALQDQAMVPLEEVEAEAIAWVGEYSYALVRSRMDGFRIRARGAVEIAAERTARRLRIHEQSHAYIKRPQLAEVEQALLAMPGGPRPGVMAAYDGLR